MSKITNNTKDAKGLYRDSKLINSLWMHSGNNKLYIVTGFVWHCDTDEWHIKIKPYFKEHGDVIEYTRSWTNFFGDREVKGKEPTKRFTRVTRESFDEEIDE